jgi:hypothetical protein
MCFCFRFCFCRNVQYGVQLFSKLGLSPRSCLLQNLIRRHVYEKRFLRVFGAVRARLSSTMRKSAEKIIFFQKKFNMALIRPSTMYTGKPLPKAEPVFLNVY